MVRQVQDSGELLKFLNQVVLLSTTVECLEAIANGEDVPCPQDPPNADNLRDTLVALAKAHGEYASLMLHLTCCLGSSPKGTALEALNQAIMGMSREQLVELIRGLDGGYISGSADVLLDQAVHRILYDALEARLQQMTEPQ